MALHIIVEETLPFVGTTSLPTYVRIESVFVTKTISRANAVFHYIDGNGAVIKQRHYDFDLIGENPVRQAYLYLKTLPEFAGATDC